MFYFSLFFLLSYSFFTSAMLQKQLIAIPDVAYSSEAFPENVLIQFLANFYEIKRDYNTLSKEELENLYTAATILAIDLRVKDDTEYQISPLKKSKKALWKVFKNRFPDAISPEFDQDQSDKEDEIAQTSSDTFEAKIKATEKRALSLYERSKSCTALIANVDLKTIEEAKNYQELDNEVINLNEQMTALQIQMDKLVANKKDLVEKRSRHEQNIDLNKKINSLLEKNKKANHSYVQKSLDETNQAISHNELSIAKKEDMIKVLAGKRKNCTLQEENKLTDLSAKLREDVSNLTSQLQQLQTAKTELEKLLSRIDKPRQTLTGSLKDNTQIALKKAASAFWGALGYTETTKEKNTQSNEK